MCVALRIVGTDKDRATEHARPTQAESRHSHYTKQQVRNEQWADQSVEYCVQLYAPPILRDSDLFTDASLKLIIPGA